MKKVVFLILLLFLTGCTGYVVLDAEKEGPFTVVKVIDGDTLDLNNSERIRLSGINTPETGECYYEEAKERLKELTLNKEVYLEKDISDKDKYGRYLRYIYINNETINSILVREGFAKVYDKYKEDTKRYSQLKEEEQKALSQNLGVWSCQDPKEDCLYVGSKNSKLYHDLDCKYAKKIKPENLICYKTEEEVKGLEKSEC